MERKLEAFRYRVSAAEVRSEEKSSKVVGYAAVFDAEYDDGFMIESVKPGAFTRALAEKHDVRALIDHDPTLIIGRTASDTLVLTEDGKGLWTETELPDTTYANDLRQKMSRRDVDQMSFGFVVRDENWGMRDGKLFREILDVDLWDVSVVTFPAYKQTSAHLRSAGLAEFRSYEEILQAGKEAVLAKTCSLADIEALHATEERYLAWLARL